MCGGGVGIKGRGEGDVEKNKKTTKKKRFKIKRFKRKHKTRKPDEHLGLGVKQQKANAPFEFPWLVLFFALCCILSCFPVSEFSHLNAGPSAGAMPELSQKTRQHQERRENIIK